MEQERLGREREKTDEEVMAHFERWLKNPEVPDLVCQKWVKLQERERRMRAIFGVAAERPAPPEDTASNGESNLVKLLLPARLKAPPENHYEINGVRFVGL
jgi:hypothetical protein